MNDIKIAGVMALWRFPLWEQSFRQLVNLSDKVFVRFDLNDGEPSIPSRVVDIGKDKLESMIARRDPWTKAGWREQLLRMLDDYKPDIVLFIDDDEMYGEGIEKDIVDFYNSGKGQMMFKYKTPLPTMDGSVVNRGKPYPGLPHMKAFRWKEGLTYHPYPTLAKLGSYKGEEVFEAQSEILHYCMYTKELQRSHVFNKIKERG